MQTGTIELNTVDFGLDLVFTSLMWRSSLAVAIFPFAPSFYPRLQMPMAFRLANAPGARPHSNAQAQAKVLRWALRLVKRTLAFELCQPLNEGVIGILIPYSLRFASYHL